ncbi:MAG: cytochrome P450 [Chloroflexota bacterium]|nr:MAG: cytochrome P450 [Chloroflexota bacterium]
MMTAITGAQKRHPPGPKGHFLLGNLRDFSHDPPAYLVHLAEEYGPISRLRVGPFWAYLIAQPGYVREVLIGRAANFPKARLSQLILGKFLGQGLLLSNGGFHRQQRALIQPAFHARRIEAYGRTMVEYTQDMLANWRPGQVLDVDHEMMRLTMFIVAKTLFDADVSETAERAGEAIQELQEAANLEYRRSFAMPMWLPTPNNRRIRRATAVVDEVVEGIIAERRAAAKGGQVEDTGDLLSMLLLARTEDGRPMDDQQIRDEAVTLFAAGHETTSNALTWTWYYLAQHPDVEASLHGELRAVLNGRAPTVTDLRDLPYTEMVLKESMRLRPPAWILNGRTTLQDTTIGGYTIPAGGTVFVSPYQLHRLPEYFPDPERFDPERFSPENEKKLPRYAYLPFGAGPRICIGNSFAMMEARLVLAAVAQRFCLEMVPGQTVEMSPLITLSPTGGLRMKVTAR